MLFIHRDPIDILSDYLIRKHNQPYWTGDLWTK